MGTISYVIFLRVTEQLSTPFWWKCLSKYIVSIPISNRYLLVILTDALSPLLWLLMSWSRPITHGFKVQSVIRFMFTEVPQFWLWLHRYHSPFSFHPLRIYYDTFMNWLLNKLLGWLQLSPTEAPKGSQTTLHCRKKSGGIRTKSVNDP